MYVRIAVQVNRNGLREKANSVSQKVTSELDFKNKYVLQRTRSHRLEEIFAKHIFKWTAVQSIQRTLKNSAIRKQPKLNLMKNASNPSTQEEEEFKVSLSYKV